MTNNKEHTISLLVNNQPGVLSRVSGVFSSRGYNISSLCVAETRDPSVSRITLTSTADGDFTEKIKKQLEKLVDVIEVADYSGSSFIRRELMLISIEATPENRQEIMWAAGLFGCRVAAVNGKYLILEVVGRKEETEAVLSFLSPLGAEVMNRTGTIAIGLNGMQTGA